MTIKPIRDDDNLRLTFSQLEKVFQAQESTLEADEREILAWGRRHRHRARGLRQ